ncbi:hypothetical protein cje104_01686, partial [Campylobacter jejuni subsp. jejuni LMG 23223]
MSHFFPFFKSRFSIIAQNYNQFYLKQKYKFLFFNLFKLNFKF